jgi:hypothetical protein
VNEELKKLLELYEALQDCPPTEQADRQSEFRAAVHATADAHGLFHWHVTAHVVRQWDKKCQQESRRKGLDKGRGLLPPETEGGGDI